MNEDSGGKANAEASPNTAAVSPSWQLTPEEEAALLAEYGAAGPYDDIVEWNAPSQFKSQMGDGHVFLTSAIGEDDDARDGDVAAGSGCNGGSSVSQSTRKLAHKDPFRLYLHEHFPSLMLVDRMMPPSLMETVTGALDALENMRTTDGPRGGEMEGHTTALSLTEINHFPTLERHAAVLRRGKEWARRASLAAQGASVTAMASNLLVPGAHEAPVVLRGDSSPVKAASAIAHIEDMEYRRLLESTQQLLAKATETLSADSAAACDSEAADMEHAVHELRAREALLSEDALDEYHDRVEVLNGDDDEEEVVQLLRRAREGRLRLCETLTLSKDDALARNHSVEHHEAMLVPSAEGDGANAGLLCPLMPELPYLYAFEMELPVSQAVAAHSVPVSSCTALRAHEGHPGLPSTPPSAPELLDPPANFPNDDTCVSLPQLLMRCTEVLAQIANTELCDAEVQRAAVESRQECRIRRRPGSAASKGVAHTKLRCDDRNAVGLATLRSFVQQLDVLLTPTQEEQNYRRGAARTPSIQANNEEGLVDEANNTQQERCGNSGGSAESVSPWSSSLERIRWMAARDSFLVDREAREHRRMGFEDDLVEREIRAAADQLASYAEQRTELEHSAVQAVECLCQAQRAAYVELVAAADQDRALAQQSQELRRLQEAEKLVYTLIIEWEVQREQWLQEEALSRRMLRRDANEEEQQARVATQRRLDGQMVAARKAMEQLRTAFEQQRVEPGSGTHKGERDINVADPALLLEEMTVRDSEWYCWRIAPLRRERVELLRWMTAHRKTLKKVHTLLVEAVGHYRAHLQAAAQGLNGNGTPVRALVLPQHPLLVEEGALSTEHAASHGRVLDADTFARLLWPYLHAVLRHPRRAPQYLAKLTLSLGDLRLVNWGQLRHLSLDTTPATEADHEREEAVSVPCLVKELDVSGNPLRQFDVVEAVRTFSSLQWLNVSHAQLHALDTADAIDITSETPGAGLPEQCRGSAARAASARPSHLRHVTAARNHALAAQVHLLSLDVSSNSLTSLTPLSTIATSSLVRCMAKTNKLTTLDSLSGCVQLRELSAAHNKLTNMLAVSALPLLRELDVQNNDLASLTARTSGNGEEVMPDSLLLLRRLNASHNPLRALPPSQYVYPSLTHLVVNHAKLTSLDVSSLGWLPMLTELQAEGNEISNIGGVRHCSRLQSLRLSHNRLASLSSLEPLRCCTRLRVLDLTGNPCFVTIANDVQCVAAVTRALYELVPSLEELNNSRRAHVPAQRQVPGSHAASIGAPTRGTEVDALLGHGKRADAALAALATPSSRYRLCATPQLYREVFSALCWDAHMQQLLEEKQLHKAVAVRSLHRSESGEPHEFADTAATGGENDRSQPHSSHCAWSVSDIDRLTARQSHVHTVEHECHMEHYRLDAAAVSEWISLCERSLPAALPVPAEGDPLANMHVRNLSYEQQQQDYVERLARVYIGEWLQGRVLVRRARLDLHRLRAAYWQSEARRQELAARRIQPVWRGAALRSRLRRILHPKQAGDGEGTVVDDFVKVDVDNWLADSASVLAPVELLFHDVVESACGIDAVPFSVPAMTATPAVLTSTGAPSASASTTFTPVPSTDARPHKGLASGGSASPSSADKPLNDVAVTRQGKGTCSTLVDQWGPLVAAQIRKRQQKSTRTRQQHMRKEFLDDPLRVKRELREDHAQQRPK
ncbi:hypothetical protein GH5_02785 [Leishmania sp. Ghana 2012 LV757]|uniref:hypothetical protein n=1 Tax=Leishmania sp. Ghana 2012 LV757 TaxID=2803181 RepID=UPI001B3CBFCB|nr:hypothetical protein GH5_02785 [Leishmania sp. Ghana 2012 LV757]